MPRSNNELKFSNERLGRLQSEHAAPHNRENKSSANNRGREGGIFNNLLHIISDNLGGGMS